MTEFKKWAGKMFEGYFDKERYSFTFMKNVTICYDKRTNKTGVARCHPEDEFKPYIGRAIAYARCKGYEVPRQKTYKTLEEMKNGEVFCSKVGGNYTYIGKCAGFQEDSVGYVVQSESTRRICVVYDGNFNYEMVD